jgi:hypothetical protein
LKDYLDKALKKKPEGGQLAVVVVAEKIKKPVFRNWPGPGMELQRHALQGCAGNKAGWRTVLPQRWRLRRPIPRCGFCLPAHGAT